MDLPLQFPDPREDARNRAAELQQLSSDEKWQKMAELFALGWATIEASPHRAALLRWMDEQEQEWRRIQTELFARFGAGPDTCPRPNRNVVAVGQVHSQLSTHRVMMRENAALMTISGKRFSGSRMAG